MAMAAQARTRMSAGPDEGDAAGAGAPAPRVVGFVFQLQLKQLALGHKQGAFAELLGVDRSVWYLIRRGETRPTWAVIKRVLELWPGEFEAYLPELILVWGD